MPIPDLQMQRNALLYCGMRYYPEGFTINVLKEEDAPELAALEAQCFSTPFSADTYRQIVTRPSSLFSHGFQDILAQQTAPHTGEHAPGNENIDTAQAHDAPAFETPVLGMRDTYNRLAAYISLGVYRSAYEAEIFNIAVRQRYRRQGLGRCLLFTSLAVARRAGIQNFFLEVRVSNRPALALYTSAGFAVTGRRKCYYADTGEDALVLMCALEDWDILHRLKCLR